VDDRTKTEDEIKKAEQHEALRQTFSRLLDDPQVQQKIVAWWAVGSGKSGAKWRAAPVTLPLFRPATNSTESL
jgi:hypothetical protein